MGGTGGLSSHSRTGRRESTAAFSGGESGMGGMSGGYNSTSRMNGGGYGMATGGGTLGGYTPADTTPQKATVIRDDYGNHSPAASEDRFKQKAKYVYRMSHR